MDLKEKWLDLKNRFDFAIRNRLPWSPPWTSSLTLNENDHKLQNELVDFLNSFAWNSIFSRLTSPLTAIDVGARNFALGPALDKFLEARKFQAQIHGIEVDAYRRLSDFRTRADHGKIHASRMRDGRFHAMDFFQWKRPVDLVCLLNPFLSAAPLLKWGLPARFLKPEAVFEHSRELLVEKRGFLLLGTPTTEEFHEAIAIASAVGFQIGPKGKWEPQHGSVQKASRLGMILSV